MNRFLGVCAFVLLNVASATATPITIDNKIAGDGRFSVAVDTGGSSVTGEIDPNGAPPKRDVFYAYDHYVDVGAPGGAFKLQNTTITTQPFLSGTGQVTSAGEFQGENGKIQWTAVSTIVEGDDVYFTKLIFRSAQPFGRVRLIQYFDEDVDGYNDDQLVVVGTPGASDFQLLTVDAAENVGVAQGAYFSESVRMNYLGWAADKYPELQTRIQSTTTPQTFSVSGVIDTTDLPPKSDSRYPGLPVYGTADITSGLAFQLQPDATFASATLYVGSSRDGQPIVIAPSERLRTPAHTKFNTYLNQWNYLELISAGSKPIDVRVRLFNLLGQELVSVVANLAANSQRDIDVNTLLKNACISHPSLCTSFPDLDGNGVPDTYGLIRLEFEDSDPDRRLLGRMSNYRQNPGASSFSFAFARELSNPIRGASYSASNTYDPQGSGYLVPNWTEVINLSASKAAKFLYNLYDQGGARILSERFTLPPLGERDLQAGHEIRNPDGSVDENVYLVEVIPEDENAEYLMYVSRYSSNAPGANALTYNYAFSLEGRNGESESVFAPITAERREDLCATTSNWVEVVNVRDIPVRARAIFKNVGGTITGDQRMVLAPKSQFHFNATAMLPAGGLGTVEISSEEPKGLISQSLVYYHDCEVNQLQTAYVTPLAKRGNSSLAGTANTFLEMENLFRTYATVPDSVTVQYSIRPVGGDEVSDAFILQEQRIKEINLNNNPVFSLPSNSYGILTLATGAAGDAASQVLRLRRDISTGRARIDYVMPTAVR